MTSSSELQQLIDAVQRQPGARAYALLAERYLEQGELTSALEVCAAGFAVNPAYERGAVAYLAGLRSAEDIQTAGEVYARAVAEQPRSSRLRVAWAKILLDAGREYEARLRTREAVNLDPMNRDARALLATLGGTPPPSRRTTGGIELVKPPETTREYGVPGLRPEDDLDAASEAEENGTIEYGAPVARVKTLADRSGADARFDFTPAPVLRRDEPPPLDTLADFFDVPEVPPPSTPPKPVRPSAPHRAAAPPAPPPLPPPSPLVPPAITAHKAPRPDLTGPQPSQDLFPDLAVARPLTPPTERPARRRAQTTGQLPPLAEPAPKRRWPWLAVAFVVLAGAGVAAGLTYRHLRRQKLEDRVSAAMARLAADDANVLEDTRRQVCALAETERALPRASAACALLSAQLLERFDRKELRQTAESSGRRARERAPAEPWTHLATAWLELANDKPEGATKPLAQQADSWQLRLVRATALERSGHTGDALATLAPLADSSAPAAPMAAAARLARLRGDRKAAQRFLDRGLSRAPTHPGMLLQRALLDAAGGKLPASLARLRTLAGDVPAYRADVALLDAQQELVANRPAKAHTLAAEAAKLAGSARPETGWMAGLALLEPGGDVARAYALLERWGPVLATYRPTVALQRVRVLLALGRPREADVILQKIDNKSWPKGRRQQLRLWQVRVADALDDPRRMQDLCPPTLASGLHSQMVACAEALLPRGKQRAVTRWLRRLSRKTPVARYLRGLLALARGDGSKAVKRLTGLPAMKEVAAPRALHALARAQLLRSDVAGAIATLRKALHADAGSVQSRVALAKALLAGGHDTEAREVLERVLAAKPTDPTLLADAGQALLTLGRPAQASQLVRKAAQSNPDSPALQLLAGRLALLEKRFDDAQKLFAAVLAKEPGQVVALVELGRIATQKKKTRDARRYFAQALKRRPEDPDLRIQLADVYLQLRRHKKAYKHAQKAIDLLKKSKKRARAVEVMIAVGKQLRTGNRWARRRAEEMLFEASTSGAPPALAFYELGLVHKQKKDRARAIWCFKETLKRDPKMANAYLQLGLLQRMKRRSRRAARRSFKRYLKLAPPGPQADRVRALLR